MFLPNEGRYLEYLLVILCSNGLYDVIWPGHCSISCNRLDSDKWVSEVDIQWYAGSDLFQF